MAGSKNRFGNIDLLRATAIVPVMLFHYTTRFTPEFYRATGVPFHMDWGKFGVDLFFVVSGYCIFMTLDSSSSLSHFWAKRFARIHPAYVASVVITFAALAIFGLPGHEASVVTAIVNAFWLTILPGRIPPLDGVYWSLIVELKFYMFIGVIYWLCSGRNVSLWWTLFSLVAAAAHWLVGRYGDLALIGPFAPSFLVGLLAYECSRLPRSQAVAIGIVAALLTVSLGRFEDRPWIGLAVMTLGFVVLQMKDLKVPRSIQFVGLISYSLYLVHNTTGLIAIRLLSPLPMWVRIPIVVCFVTALATILNRTVELRWQKRLTALLQAGMDGAWAKLPRPRRRAVGGELRRW